MGGRSIIGGTGSPSSQRLSCSRAVLKLEVLLHVLLQGIQLLIISESYLYYALGGLHKDHGQYQRHLQQLLQNFLDANPSLHVLVSVDKDWCSSNCTCGV